MFRNQKKVVLLVYSFSALSLFCIKRRVLIRGVLWHVQVFKALPVREFLETPDVVGNDKHKEYDFGRR